MKKKFIIYLNLLLVPFFSFAMSSSNYKINADEIGVGGGLGNSASYKVIDTIGEPIIGNGQSESYKIKAGFIPMTNYSLSLVVDSNVKDLGSVTPGGSVQGQSTLNVTTDSWGGYDLLINQNHSMLHADAVTTIADFSCEISSPCGWVGNGFGFSVNSATGVDAKWGSNPNYNYAAVPLSATVFHSKSGYTSGIDQTVVGYKISISQSQKSGNYSNAVTYTALAKL
jgi:hypothetical protein